MPLLLFHEDHLLDAFEPITVYVWDGTSILSPVSPLFVLTLVGAT